MAALEALRSAKLKPLTILLLLAGVVVVAYIALGVSVVRERRSQYALSSQIVQGEGVLVAVDESRQALKDLEARLGAAEEELAVAQGLFPEEVDGGDVLQTILADASESGARVLRVEAQPPTTEADEEKVYTVFGFGLEVEGNAGQIVAFLAALENGSIGASKTGAFSLEGGGELYTMKLEVLTYAKSVVEPASAPEGVEGPSGPATEPAPDGESATSE